MRNFSVNIIPLIADNLRNRYNNGFPVLKELIQNADDAQAASLCFGAHSGFEQTMHPLLKGPALWFWNDGKIKPGDVDAVCSFAIGPKAGDADAIGKFGLGMKSVFHLCEAFFFIARHGEKMESEFLCPWDSQVHPDWSEVSEPDWANLRGFGEAQASLFGKVTEDWFLLWLPLRQERHLKKTDGTRTGAIINRFPGDPGEQDLAFLRESDLALRLAEIMPMLRHLKRIEAVGGHELINPFAVDLSADGNLYKNGQVHGKVCVSKGSSELKIQLGFSGRRTLDGDNWFDQIRKQAEWPVTFVRDPQTGVEQQKADRAFPEAAVLFARAEDADRLSLRWAVFLPLSEREETKCDIRAESHFRVTLHGQFFVDSGRKDVFGWDALFGEVPGLPANFSDEAALRRNWNARLFQRVLAPMVLPGLESFVKAEKLDDKECRALTIALADTDLYQRGWGFLCRDQAWCRRLEKSGASWERIGSESLSRLLPLPPPPKSDTGRPWKVFPELENMNRVVFDAEAPRLGAPTLQWPEGELKELFKKVNVLLSDGTHLEYLLAFLAHQSCAKPYLGTAWLQCWLIELLRNSFLNTDMGNWGDHEQKVQDLIAFVQPARRHSVGVDLVSSVWKSLLKTDADALLVPKRFDPRESMSTLDPDFNILPWLEILDSEVEKRIEAGAMEALLTAATGLLETRPLANRRALLQQRSELRVISVRDVRIKRDRAVSLQGLNKIKSDGVLLSFAGALGDGQYGFSLLLAPVLPEADICLIQARYRDLVGDTAPAGADVPSAILAAVASHKGPIVDSIEQRITLLEKVNDSGNDTQARRGLRRLLHGQSAQCDDGTADLWVPRQDQHPAWVKLWRQWYGATRWCLLDRGLAGYLSTNSWSRVGIKEIAPEDLIKELAKKFDQTKKIVDARIIPEPAEFEVNDRDEILSRIDDPELWKCLPLHTRFSDDSPVSLSGSTPYLAPETGCPDSTLLRTALVIRRSANAVQARNQAIWLRPLDDQALIEIATRVDSPVEHWQTILDSIERLPEVDRENLVNLSPELLSTTWLPTRFDAPVAPEYVLNLPPAFKDQATRLVAAHQAIHRPCFAVPEDLADAVRQHPGFAWLQENAFSKERSGLERLARLLTDLPEQQIGDWKTPTKAMIELLANFPQLPGWALLRDAIAAFPDTEHSRTISFLWDGLKGAPAGEKILAVLNWLTSETNRWNERKIAVDGYLRQFIAEDIRPENWLARIKLASQTHTWEDPQDLCAGAIGVDPAQTLDRMQADILKKLIYCVDQQLGKDDAQDINEERGIAWFERMRAAAPQVFERAFEGWQSLIDRPMIGAIAGLLGTELRQIASAWLHPHSFDWLKNQLRPSWRDPGQNNNRIEWMGGRTLDQALESIEVGMVLAVGDSKKLINLLGEPIQVRLQAAKDIQHLVVVAPQWKGGCRVKIDLRRVDPINQSSDRLADLLRRTAECIYENFYNQPKPDFGALWNDLEQTRQLDIATARRMILDNIAFYLRQLSIRDDNLKKLLTCCDNAQQRLAELQEDHGKDNSSYLSAAERTYREAIDTLGHKIENDQALRDAVLAGVRSRVRDSQYRSDSIPFEMFQNADDAVVELGQIQAYPDTGCEIPDTARRLVIEYGPERLRLLHWGRSLNDRGPMGFKGDERGFGRDLKKMLVLSGSDKHPDAGVTGRLGLGFKSVLLVCDRPRIVSGRLAVEIVGGILPASWFDPAEARECLRRNSNEYPTLPGTLIELTAVDDAKQREVLKRFKRLAGMLCVFARAIRRIDLRGEHTEAPGRHYQWSPTELVAGLEIGSLHLESPDWGNQSNALCLRTDQGSLLFALGPSGFRPLPDDVPAVWVTAPTIESAVLGFAINGSFGLDPGRARLAAENAENLERAERLGTATGLIMKKLLEATTDEWPQYRERLQLAAELNAHDFWTGVWIGLTQMWLGRQRDAAGELARATLRQLIETLADLPRAVPNGLPNLHGAMVSKQDIRFELAAALGTAEVASTLYYWPRFIARYERAATVTEAIGAILKHCQLATLTSIGPAALLKLCNEQVEPVDAVALGRILDETEDAIPWDKGDLRDLLRKMQFRAQDGSWKSAHQLLTDGRLGGESAIVEEQMRFAVAPLDRRLRGEYADQPDGAVAIELFMRCRERLEADARELATWIRAAEDDTLRIASLQLLARSDRRGEIAAQVRGRDWLISARGRDELLQAAQLTLPEQAELRRLLAGDDLIHRAIQIEMAAAESSPVDVGWNIDLKTALERIYDWWGQNREDLGQEYQKKLYPWEVNLTENVETGRICRSSWLTLFALGAFQSVSWRDDGRNRNFLALCKDRGWWQIFSERDPRDCPDQWMDIIEQYAESQHDDQQWAEWVAQFPNLYRLARWLDEYIELFKSIERHNAPFAIDSIVAPRAESAYQGGGYDAPPINRTLKVGKHLVIRELLRYRILTNPHAVPYAYAPTAQICRLFRGFAVEVESSTAINQLLVQHLCADHAKFQNDYDVPLRLVAGDPGLQAQLFR